MFGLEFFLLLHKFDVSICRRGSESLRGLLSVWAPTAAWRPHHDYSQLIRQALSDVASRRRGRFGPATTRRKWPSDGRFDLSIRLASIRHCRYTAAAFYTLLSLSVVCSLLQSTLVPTSHCV